MSELDFATLRRLYRLIFQARLVLFWENLWPRFWPFLIVSSLFIITILFNGFSALPVSVHLLLLGLFGLSLFVSLLLAFRGVTWPSQAQALHRLEKDSGFKDQPLFALTDRPVSGVDNKFAQAIWINHQDRMSAAMKHVVLQKPQSHLHKRDPYSLRALLIIGLVLGVIEARFDYTDRLMRAFVPTSQLANLQNWKIQAWVTPPAHTGLSPSYLTAEAGADGARNPLKIAQHSKFLVRLEGHPTQDTITVSMGPFEEKLENLGKGVFSLETVLDQGEDLVVKRDGDLLYHWPVRIVADMPPQIKLNEELKIGFRGHMSIPYEAYDDYGLKQVALEVRRLVANEVDPVMIETPVDGVKNKSSFRGDFTAHPWAGKKVTLTPKVTDNAEQTAFGYALEIVLPERNFTHPLAQELVGLRKQLYDQPKLDRLFIRLRLDQLLQKPAAFDHNLSMYFALRVATDRLYVNMTKGEVESVQTILWETAVFLDEGAAGSARNQLEYMTQQMQEMMQSGAQKTGMESLFEQMRKSLDKYMQEMHKSMPDMKGLEQALGPQNAQMVNQDELVNMLEQARDLMRAGNIEAAKQLMEQFQSILSQLAMQKQPSAEHLKAAQDVMKNLQNVQKAEQELLDETFQRVRNQRKPTLESTQKAVEQAEEQKRIRQSLRTQMKKLKKMGAKIPDGLIEAEQAMKRASQSLERGLDEDAIQAQTYALDQLRKGLQESATSMAQKMGMPPTPQMMPGYDPMGRGMRGRMNMENGQMVPTEAEMHKSREILQELYRRAGQKNRPEQELKYIERLLERF